jgi:putative FmdB family regulatory protein
MPTYEYVCEKSNGGCGHKFDHFQGFNDEVLKLCPSCKTESLRRMFGTGAGIIFRGSGFYHTDYKLKEAGHGGQD